MNNEPREKLRQLVSEYGESLWRDPRRCKGLLQDYCSQYPTEKFLLVTALERGIVTDIFKCSQTANPPEIRLTQLSTRLQQLGIEPEKANWAIESWAQALGITARLPEISTRVSNSNNGQEEANRLRQEVQNLRQKEQHLNDELAKRSNQTTPSEKNNSPLIVLGVLSGTALLFLLARFGQLNEQVFSLKSTNENMTEKYLKRSKKLNTLENNRNNSNSFIESTSTSYTAINLCNKISNKKTIYVTFSWKNQGKWQAEGWWKVEPKKCEIIYFVFDNPNIPREIIYIYGKYFDKEATKENQFSTEDKEFCINDPDAFTIPNSDQQVSCVGEGKKMVGMSEFFIYPGENTWNFTDPESP